MPSKCRSDFLEIVGTECDSLFSMARSMNELEFDEVFQLPYDNRIWLVLQVWGAMAKITKLLSLHISRHTFATMMLGHTNDIYLVSALDPDRVIDPLPFRAIQHWEALHFRKLRKSLT